MADPQHLALLTQGSADWNRWRDQNPDISPDLRGADLREADLWGADLRGANLSVADLRGANLSVADLRGANLSVADLRGANLSRADLYEANLSDANLSIACLNDAHLSIANLSRADLKGAELRETTLRGADLSGADLSGADLVGTNLTGANLSGADFSRASVGLTQFTDTDLRLVKGLQTVKHFYPSSIGIDTIYRYSYGTEEEHAKYFLRRFLRQAGVPRNFLTYLPSLIHRAIEYYSCFISYSSKDQEFVERLHDDLQNEGVRCWYAPKNLKTGDKIRDRIGQSIRVHDKLLLVLSQHSVSSSWVEFEVEAALERENGRNALMLFPIRLDNAVKESPTSWAAHIRRTRHITDFSNWKELDVYQKALKVLLRDLQPGNPS